MFSAHSSDASWIPSVNIQRWALGESEDRAIQSSLLLDDFDRSGSQPPCDSSGIETDLAWSVESLHTRGAIGALVICALMTWCGAVFFSSRNGQLTLLIGLTSIGVFVACFGFLGAYSYQSENALGLYHGSSFSSFRSKNSAGAFLNICLAASMGLVVWTIIHLRRKKMDMRYKVSDATILMRIRGSIEDFLSDLNTPQIASILAMLSIAIAVIVSQCRGAVVAALAATVATALLTKNRSRRIGSSFAGFLVGLMSLAAIAAFQLDENSYERVQSLAEFDVEADSVNGRLYIWSVAWDAMKYYGLLGSGLGTFHYAYLPFQYPTSMGWFYHAESLYLQCGVDLGFLGLGIMLVTLAAVFWRFQKHLPSETWKLLTPIRVAAVFLLISQATHSSVDFSLILPALFIPGCLLLGASLESLCDAPRLADSLKDHRATGVTLVSPESSFSVVRWGQGIVLLILVISMGWFTLPYLSNLAGGERLQASYEEMIRVKPSQRQPDSMKNLVDTWPNDAESLKQNSDALKLLADASIQDFRVGMLLKSSASTDWDAVWGTTDPILLQLGLDRESSTEGQSRILQTAGGQEAIDALNNASRWYAKAHAQSPLNWRLAWGRCRTSLNCSRENMSSLAPVVVQLGLHVPKQLLESSLLFRQQLNDAQVDRIWRQVMQTKPSSAISTAKMMLTERDTETLDIDVFPPRTEILEALANTVFTKDKYPEIHMQLWAKAKDRLEYSKLPKSGKELWLARAAAVAGNLSDEIKHLRIASNLEPADAKLACRLGMRLVDADDIEGATVIFRRWERSAANEPELQALGQRLRLSKP
jgi:hypothetical protein